MDVRKELSLYDITHTEGRTLGGRELEIKEVGPNLTEPLRYALKKNMTETVYLDSVRRPLMVRSGPLGITPLRTTCRMSPQSRGS